MRRRTLPLVGILLMLAHLAVGQVYQGTGYLHFEDGEVVEFEALSPLHSRSQNFQDPLKVRGTSSGPVVEIEWEDIQELVWIGEDREWLPDDDGRLHVTLRNGQEGEFYIESMINIFEYQYFDSFTESQQEDRTGSENIERIVFGEDFGNARVNPETGEIWPRSYRFDPYTGEELEWTEIGGQSLRIDDDEEIAVVQEYDFVETDVSVPGFSGPVPVEGEVSRKPMEEQAEHELEDAAVDYATTMTNPFSSSDEVSEKLDAVRDAVEKD